MLSRNYVCYVKCSTKELSWTQIKNWIGRTIWYSFLVLRFRSSTHILFSLHILLFLRDIMSLSISFISITSSSVWICVCTFTLYSGFSFVNNFGSDLFIAYAILFFPLFPFSLLLSFLLISVLRHIFRYRYLSLCISYPISYFFWYLWFF